MCDILRCEYYEMVTKVFLPVPLHIQAYLSGVIPLSGLHAL